MELSSILGLCTAVIAILGLIGAVIARDRSLNQSIRSGDEGIELRVDAKVSALHERINKTRDEFVRRDDFASLISRFDDSVRDLSHEVKGTNDRIDQFMSAIASGKTHAR